MSDRSKNGEPVYSGGLTDVSGIVYGTRIQGRLPPLFQQYLWPSATHCDEQEQSVSISYQTLQELPRVDEFWAEEHEDLGINSRFSMFKQEGGFGLKIECQGHGLFRISPEEIKIEWMPDASGPAHYLFSYALPLWLESTGTPVLHASAVSFGDRAVAFLGKSGMGKSTICWDLVRSGCEFIADDGLALRAEAGNRWCCSHGPPFLKLWPSTLEKQPTIDSTGLAKVYRGFDKRLLPLVDERALEEAKYRRLAAVYVLERVSETRRNPAITRYSPSESLLRLIEFSLAGSPAEALGLTAQRLKQMARIVSATGVKQLHYPSDGDRYLIKKIIMNDLDELGSVS